MTAERNLRRRVDAQSRELTMTKRLLTEEQNKRFDLEVELARLQRKPRCGVCGHRLSALKAVCDYCGVTA